MDKRVLILIIILASMQIAGALSNGPIEKKEDVEITDIEPILPSYETCIENIYCSLDFKGQAPNELVFELALQGYFNILSENPEDENIHILSIADYSLSANEKRLWVIDMKSKTVLYNEYVAHGMGTGEEYASNFSNTPQSHQSSLGFFKTGVIYDGKHNMSLKLHGLENSFNSNAYERGIVIHGADYVSEEFIAANGRLGRSHGCPAVSQDVKEDLISTIADGSVFFSYFPDQSYLNQSQFLSGMVEVPAVSWLVSAAE